MRIEVCGGIASGKTTFAGILGKIGFEPLFERFDENPFWRSFYADPIKYSFETEVTFLLQHYHQIKIAIEKGKPTVCDFSLVLDRAYADVTLGDSCRKAFLAVHEKAKSELPPVSLLVHLRCSAETELERIRRRAREVEEKITTEYLKAINSAVKQQINVYSSQVSTLTIDSGIKNFVDDKDVQEEVLNDVVELLQLQERI